MQTKGGRELVAAASRGAPAREFSESNAVEGLQVAVQLMVGVRHQTLQLGTGEDGCRLK